MTWKMQDKEFESVIALPHQLRHEYFIKKVAYWGTIWSLGSDDGWAPQGDDQGYELVPVWPHERFAAACIGGEWDGNEARPIDLTLWMDKWIPGMSQDGRLVCVSPTPDGKGITVRPERLKKDLEEELSRLMISE